MYAHKTSIHPSEINNILWKFWDLAPIFYPDRLVIEVKFNVDLFLQMRMNVEVTRARMEPCVEIVCSVMTAVRVEMALVDLTVREVSSIFLQI